MARLILVRHGECDGNKDGCFRGRFDFPLNERGITQSQEVAEALKTESFSYVYTSPLKRAYQTACSIAETNSAEIIALEVFNNISLGAWEGQSKEVIKKQYPEQWEIWKKNPEALELEACETLKDVQKRALAGVDTILKKHPAETVVLVAHRAVLRPLIAGLLGMSSPYFWKIHMDNCALSVIETFQDCFMLMSHNYTDHLTNYLIERY